MTWRGRNIYLIGLPGAGKSTVGRELLKLIAKNGYQFADLDETIEKRSGRKVEAIFEPTNGEHSFRGLETDALLELSNCAFTSNPVIVATGGGAVLRPVNRAIMRGSGIVVWIDVNVRQAAKQVLKGILEGQSRPLLRASSPEDLVAKLRVLLEKREPLYAQAMLHFVAKNPRGEERTPSELAEELLKALEQMSRRVRFRPRFHTVVAESALGPYPVAIGNGIVQAELLASIRDAESSHVAVLTDKNVTRLHASRIVQKLAQDLGGKSRVHLIALDPGEKSKNYETLTEILNSFFKLEMPRRTGLVVTIGGGVVSDLGGLAANLYNRGLPVIHVPTTLLGQVDAALGGKTGIDYCGSKNAIGTFYTPRRVLIDPLFLKTLDKRQLHAGLGEVFKYALIGSRPMWDVLSKSVRRLIRGVDSSYESIIRLAVDEKLRYIQRDEFERHEGVRELLNFGHTFGHALEAAAGFETFLHGEAVLLGMRAAAWLSMQLGLLSDELWREAEIVLGRIPIAATTSIGASEVVSALALDKKRSAQGARFVLLRSIGEAVVVDKIPESDLREAVQFMLSLI